MDESPVILSVLRVSKQQLYNAWNCIGLVSTIRVLNNKSITCKLLDDHEKTVNVIQTTIGIQPPPPAPARAAIPPVRLDHFIPMPDMPSAGVKRSNSK